MAEELIRELRSNHRVSNARIKEFCARQVPAEIFHYTLSQMRAIDTLYALTRDTGKGVQLKVLAEKLSITPAAASEMVDTLVKKGVLTRTPDPRDRRAIAISVSDELQKRIFSSEDGFDRVTSDFLATLSSEDQVNFIRTVNLWAEFAKQHGGPFRHTLSGGFYACQQPRFYQ